MPAAAPSARGRRQDGDPARVQETMSRVTDSHHPRCGWHPPCPRAASAPGQLHLLPPEPLVVMDQGMT